MGRPCFACILNHYPLVLKGPVSLTSSRKSARNPLVSYDLHLLGNLSLLTQCLL